MVAAVDDDQVLDATRDIEVALVVGAVVAGLDPHAVVGGALGVRLADPRLEDVAEDVVGLLLPAPVAGAQVVAVQPDLADLTVRQLARRLGVDDDGPLVNTDGAGRDLRNGLRRIGGHLDEALLVQLVTVDVDDRGRLVHRRGGDEQRRLGQAVGRLDRGLPQTVGGERLVELAHRRRGHRFAAVEDRLDVAQVQRRLTLLGHPAHRRVLEGEVRGDGEDLAVGSVLGLARHLADPPARPAYEGGRRHEGEVVAEHRRQQRRDQPHVVEERQPAQPAVALLALQAVEHLQHVGGQVEVGDLHARRGPGGAGRVLQVGDGVLVGLGRLPGGRDLVGDRVDGDDAGPLLGRTGADELADAFGGVGGGQDRRGGAVVEDGVQAADVTRLGRVEQRHRDPAGVQRAEERDEVVEVLRAQHGDAVARLGDLLQAGAHGPVAGAEVAPHDVAVLAVAFGGEVDKPVGELVATHPRPLLNVLDQVRVVGELDLSIHDERVVVRHAALLSHLYLGRLRRRLLSRSAPPTSRS